MTAWQETLLGDLCSLITDGKHGDCKDEEGSGYYFISCKDVKDGYIHYDNARQIVRTDFAETHRRTNLTPGDVVLTNSGTIGRIAIATDDDRTERTTFQKSVAILKPIREQITPHFLYYSLEANRTKLVNAAGGAAQKNLLIGELRRFPMRVPPLAQQFSITSRLSAYDDLIENNRRRIELLEQAARLLYKEWFVHLRFPGHEHAKIKNGLPLGWKLEPFGNLTTKIGSGATPRGGAAAYQAEGITLIRSQNVYDYRFEDDGLAFINDEQAESLSNVTVEPSDILLNITGASVGRCCMVPERHLPARVNQHVMIIRVHPGKIGPNYLLHGINSHQMKQTILSIARAGGATREALTKDVVSGLQIIVPTPQLIADFEDTAGRLLNQQHILSQQNVQLAKARELLLPRLMNGEVVV